MSAKLITALGFAALIAAAPTYAESTGSWTPETRIYGNRGPFIVYVYSREPYALTGGGMPTRKEPSTGWTQETRTLQNKVTTTVYQR